MKKLTLHRETLRLVSFQAPTRDKVEKATAAASVTLWHTNGICLDETFGPDATSG
ncbi:MAG TPA: hypothetical protein VF615_12255 [Longimicrobiaceae bacterium]|jgi:hypothetical protein